MSWFKENFKKFINLCKTQINTNLNNSKNIESTVSGNQENNFSKQKTINKNKTIVSNTYNISLSNNNELNKKTIENIVKNSDLIEKALDDNWEPKNISENKIMNDLIKDGLIGTKNKAKYVAYMVKKLQKYNDENKFEYEAKNIKIAIEFILTANDIHKSFLVWSFVLKSIYSDYSKKSWEFFKSFINDKKIENKYNIVPFGSLLNIGFLSSFNWNFTLGIYIGSERMELIKKEFPHLEKIEGIWSSWNNIPPSLEIAVEALLNEL